MLFHLKIYIATPNTCNPVPRVMKFSFVRQFLGHHYFVFSLSDLSSGVEITILQEIMHFHLTIYMATPLHKNLMVVPSLTINIYSVCLIYAQEKRKKNLKE